MTRRAIIFHGTGANPDVCWYRWLGDRLAARGFAVEIPHYPGLNVEPAETFVPHVLGRHRFDESTVLVGHSGGAALLLSLLEHLDVRVAQAILVAGYCTPPNDADEPVLQSSYDWAAISAHVADLYLVNSVTDPYGCDAEQGRAMFDHLGGTQIVRDEGHFGDVDQPFPTFPLIDRLVADLP
ncbi:alpha/beta hydrolase [Sanguibacter antarcticus]|uniref:alpha/beta hydrolase n=1 Tax=Sanguibacter antarcticus TaxID=372484 RepID=UPI000BF877AE|nr:alpha/beta hydrolase [Sanguibacter antarcticus]